MIYFFKIMACCMQRRSREKYDGTYTADISMANAKAQHEFSADTTMG